MPRMPFGAAGLSVGTVYSVTFPVVASILPMICSPNAAYQTVPDESTITSWGCRVRAGRSYSV